MGLKVALSGATGYIGKHLAVRLLSAGHDVRALTRRSGGAGLPLGVTLIHGDLTGDCAPLAALLDGVDVFFHCAAELHDPSEMRRVNVQGTRRLLESARGRLGRWVQLSSAGVYGSNASGEINESTLVAPRNPYERSKAEADDAVIAAAAKGDFQYAILRPTNVFGPDMSNRSLIQWARLVKLGLYFHVGPAGASANYIHADNVVHALELCGTHPDAAGRLFNLSDYRTMEEFVGTMATVLNVRAPTHRLPIGVAALVARIAGWVPGNPLTNSRLGVLTDRSTYPIDLIKSRLGYRHVISMEDGLSQTIRSFFPTS